MRRIDEPVSLAPFLAWVEGRERQHAHTGDPVAAVVRDIGWDGESGVRRLHRWRHESITGMAERADVEDALHHAGVRWDEVYDPDPVDLGEGYCPRCLDTVGVQDGRCVWCSATVTTGEGLRKAWCEACDSMGVPVNDRCRRCAAPATGKTSPWDDCACGCGGMVRRFDQNGRRARWIRGHAPRALGEPGKRDVEPFARYLERCLADVDPVDAVAVKHGMSREAVLRIMRREDPLVDGRVVQGALFRAARRGRQKGEPSLPDATRMEDLYPRTRCPGPGGDVACVGSGFKANKTATRCKECSRRAGRKTPQRTKWEPPEAFLIEARDLADRHGGLMVAARRLHDRTPMKSPESLCSRLRTEFRQRGWPTDRRTAGVVR